MERSLHRQLKERYGPDLGGRAEVVLGPFRVDAVAPDGRLIEIQSGPLGLLRGKLQKLLPDRQVCVVKPIVVARRLIRRDRPGGPCSTPSTSWSAWPGSSRTPTSGSTCWPSRSTRSGSPTAGGRAISSSTGSSARSARRSGSASRATSGRFSPATSPADSRPSTSPRAWAGRSPSPSAWRIASAMVGPPQSSTSGAITASSRPSGDSSGARPGVKANRRWLMGEGDPGEAAGADPDGLPLIRHQPFTIIDPGSPLRGYQGSKMVDG